MSQKKWTSSTIKQERTREIQEQLEQDGKDPRIAPDTQWLRKKGFSGLFKAAKREFDMGPIECLVKICGFKPRHRIGDKTIGDNEFRSIRNNHLLSLEQRGKKARKTIQTRRSRLRTLEKIFVRKTDFQNLLWPARADNGEGFCLLLTVFDEVDERMDSDQSKLNYARALRDLYDYCERRRDVLFETNPVEKILDEYGWSPDTDTEAEPITAVQSYEMLLEAGDGDTGQLQAEREENLLLVIAINGWGLRPSDITRLDVREDIILDEDPRIEFDERKNGPGVVKLIVGVDLLASHIARLREDPDWEGDLIASPQNDKNDSITEGTVCNRYKRIAKAADVTLEDGSVPTPRNGRRFWYNLYQQAVTRWMLGAENSALAQASTSEEVVDRSYLWARLRNDFFHNAAHEEFRRAFGEDLVEEPVSDPLEIEAVEEMIQRYDGSLEQDILELQRPDNHSLDEWNLFDPIGSAVETWVTVSDRLANWFASRRPTTVQERIPQVATPVGRAAWIILGISIAVTHLQLLGVSVDLVQGQIVSPSGSEMAAVLYYYFLQQL